MLLSLHVTLLTEGLRLSRLMMRSYVLFARLKYKMFSEYLLGLSLDFFELPIFILVASPPWGDIYSMS